mmetsp:Transcript_3299/g.7459  ORF Transcript_3299/g.7459 Transcript_3299/m.7459 type:complete len:276 (-) Transcript_3299:42-869(-)
MISSHVATFYQTLGGCKHIVGLLLLDISHVHSSSHRPRSGRCASGRIRILDSVLPHSRLVELARCVQICCWTPSGYRQMGWMRMRQHHGRYLVHGTECSRRIEGHPAAPRVVERRKILSVRVRTPLVMIAWAAIDIVVARGRSALVGRIAGVFIRGQVVLIGIDVIPRSSSSSSSPPTADTMADIRSSSPTTGPSTPRRRWRRRRPEGRGRRKSPPRPARQKRWRRERPPPRPTADRCCSSQRRPLPVAAPRADRRRRRSGIRRGAAGGGEGRVG